MGSLTGIPADTPLADASAVAASNRLCSTGLMAGVWGVRGVRGVPGMGASKLEAESAVKRLALSVVSWPGDGMGLPSWETVILKADGELLEVANTRGVPTGQYIAWAILEKRRPRFRTRSSIRTEQTDGSGAQGAVNMSSSGPIERPASVNRE